MLILNDADNFVAALIDDLGHIGWDRAIVKENDEGTSVVHLPLVSINTNSLTSYLVATVKNGNEVEFAMITKDFIDSIVDVNNIDFDIAYHVIVLLELEYSLFGTATQKYADWLYLFDASKFQSGAADTRNGCFILEFRCWNSDILTLQDNNQSSVREKVCAWMSFYSADCDGNITNSTGSGTVGQGSGTGGGGNYGGIGSVGNGTTTTSSTWGNTNTGGGGSSGTNSNGSTMSVFEQLLIACSSAGGDIAGDVAPGYVPIQLSDQQQAACDAITYLQGAYPSPENLEIIGNLGETGIGNLILAALYLQDNEGEYYKNLISTYASMLASNDTEMGLKEFEKLYAKVNSLKQILGLNNSEVEFLLINSSSSNNIAQRINDLLNNNPNDTDLLDAANIHIDQLISNPDYFELNELMVSIPPWMWTFLREVAIEVTIEIIKKQFPAASISNNLVDALRAIEQGDLLDFVKAAADIAKNFSLPIKVFDGILDTYNLSKKAATAYKAIKKMEKLGSDVIEKVIKTIQIKGGGLLDKLEWKGGNIGASLIGVGNSQDFYNELLSQFNVTASPTGFGNELVATVIIGGSQFKIKYYPVSNTTQGPTIEIKKTSGGTFTYKIRFTP